MRPRLRLRPRRPVARGQETRGGEGKAQGRPATLGGRGLARRGQGAERGRQEVGGARRRREGVAAPPLLGTRWAGEYIGGVGRGRLDVARSELGRFMCV